TRSSCSLLGAAHLGRRVPHFWPLLPEVGGFVGDVEALLSRSPRLLSAMKNRLAILRQNPTLLHQFIRCVRELHHIVVAICIAFLNRLTRITRRAPRDSCLRKRYVRTLKRDSLVRRANRSIAKVPARIGRERHTDFRQPNAVPFIPIAIHPRHQTRKCF